MILNNHSFKNNEAAQYSEITPDRFIINHFCEALCGIWF